MRLILLCSSITREAPSHLCQFLTKNSQIGNSRTKGNLIIPITRTGVYHKSFTFQASQIWNKLPKDLSLQSTKIFKKITHFDFNFISIIIN